MIKKHSFANPFPSIKQKFGKNGRSNSAPGAFDIVAERWRRDSNFRLILTAHFSFLVLAQKLRRKARGFLRCQRTQLKRIPRSLQPTWLEFVVDSLVGWLDVILLLGDRVIFSKVWSARFSGGLVIRPCDPRGGPGIQQFRHHTSTSISKFYEISG